MTHATRFRFDVQTPRPMTARERDAFRAALAEWAQGQVMRMGAMIPTRVTVAPEPAAESSPELRAEQERLDRLEILLDIS